MRGGEFDTFCVSNPHLSPPIPVQGGGGRNIDRCITVSMSTLSLELSTIGGLVTPVHSNVALEIVGLSVKFDWFILPRFGSGS